MNYPKIYFILLLITLYNTPMPHDQNNIFSLIANQNCVFCNPTYIYNTCNINGLMSNGNIYINQLNKEKEIIINSMDLSNFFFIINNLPISQNTNNTIFLAIDNNNKLFLEINSEDLTRNTIIPTIKDSDNESLKVLNIQTNTINQFTQPLLISATNDNDNPINISIGNKNNHLTLISNVIINSNTMIFNNTVNYPININATASVQKNIMAGTITAAQLVPNENVTINFQNIITDSLNNTSNTQSIIQGNINFNGPVSLGNQDHTNLIIHAKDENILFPIYFLGIDTNQNVFVTTIQPILKTINTHTVEGNPNLQVFTLDQTINVGNQNSNVIFRVDSLIVQNNFTSQNPVFLFLNGKNFFNDEVTFNSLNNIYYLLSNNSISLEGPVTLNQINFNGILFFPNLPILNDFTSYLGLNIEEDIAYLVTISIEAHEKNLKQIEHKFYLANTDIFNEIEHIKNEINTKIENFEIYLEQYRASLQEHLKLQKKVLYYLKVIQEKKVYTHDIKTKTILNEIKKEYL